MRTITIAMFLACSTTYAQVPDAKPTFEVATIKAAPMPDGRLMRVGCTGGPGTPDPGLWSCQNMTISNMVTNAYNLRYYEITAPAWLNEVRFDITAKIPAGTTKEQFALMRQNLLDERFKLVFHREKKDVPGYEMVVAKGGLKLKESVEEPSPEDVAPPRSPGPPGPPKLDKDGYPILSGGRGMAIMNGRARWNCPKCTMDVIALNLAGQLARPVVDATGLKGKYDVSMYWSADMGGRGPLPGVPLPPPPPGGGEVPIARTPDAESGPTLLGALQEQLGLRLEAKKTTIEILVVDKVERAPTEN